MLNLLPVERFAVLIVTPEGYLHSQAFHEMAETIHYGLTALGLNSVITSKVCPGRQHIVLGSNLLPLCPLLLPPGTILYNLEQISETSQWLSQDLLHLFQQYPMWDYSRLNIEQLVKLGIQNVQHVPIGYVPELTRIESLEETEQEIDVLFYGATNERRGLVLEALSELGLNVVAVFGVYGQERDALIAHAKIVLNIHNPYYDAQLFELVRVSYLLANQKFVVSECGSDSDEESFFAAGVAFTDYEFLVETCWDFWLQPEKRHEIARTGFKLMQARREEEYLSAALIKSLTTSP